MSSSATPALPLLPIASLDGASGYLRWKESVLLRPRTLGMAYVLFEERPTGDTVKTADKWGRDDELCRGYILATLSDRLLPVYAHHSTARAVWRAVTCTYVRPGHDVPVKGQVLRVLIRGGRAKIEEPLMFDMVKQKLPSVMSEVCQSLHSSSSTHRQHLGGCSGGRGDRHGTKRGRQAEEPCYKCGEPGHIVRECRA